MSSPLILAVSIVGGVALLGAMAYAATPRKSKLDIQSEKEYKIYQDRYFADEARKNNTRDRASLLRNRKTRSRTSRARIGNLSF
jgi:hypothetical protein